MTLDQFRLDNRVAVVSGASCAIGRSIALGLAAAGADVVVAIRKLQDLEPSPKRSVGAVLYLASDASSYVTGHTIVLDGGTLA